MASAIVRGRRFQETSIAMPSCKDSSVQSAPPLARSRSRYSAFIVASFGCAWGSNGNATRKVACPPFNTTRCSGSLYLAKTSFTGCCQCAMSSITRVGAGDVAADPGASEARASIGNDRIVTSASHRRWENWRGFCIGQSWHAGIPRGRDSTCRRSRSREVAIPAGSAALRLTWTLRGRPRPQPAVRSSLLWGEMQWINLRFWSCGADSCGEAGSGGEG